MTVAAPPMPALDRARRASGFAALAMTPACAACTLVLPAESMRAYLVAFVLWFGLGAGAVGLCVLHHLVGGAWGHPIRPWLSAAASTLPLLAILFVPLALATDWIYPWATQGHEAGPAGDFKSVYLSPRFFVVRAAACFAVIILIALLSRRMDRASSAPAAVGSGRGWCAPALILYVLALSVASVDWVMSLEPHWASPMYGLVFIVGQALLALAFGIWGTTRLRDAGLDTAHDEGHAMQDMGSLLLAFLMLWGYVAFSQYLIIWSANLPEEITYYIRRTHGGWRTLAWLLVLGHFLLPFLILLRRRARQGPAMLAQVAGWVMLMRVADVVWLVEPSFRRAHIALYGIDGLMIVGMGSLWIFWFLIVLTRRVRTLDAVAIGGARDAGRGEQP